MRIDVKSVALRLAVCALGVVIGLAAAEGLLRLFPQVLPEEAHLRLHWAAQRDTTRGIADPDIGYLNPPNAAGSVQAGEASFDYTTDQNGFRNPPPWPDRADVVAVGDSNVFGWGMPDDQAWPRKVAAGLGGARVMNLGMSGTAPQQYLRVYQRYGAPLRPGIILFALFPGNDLVDAKLFEDWLRAGKPVNYDVWRFFRGRLPRNGPAERSPTPLLKQSYLVSFLRSFNRDAALSIAGQSMECANGGRVRLAPRVLIANARMAHLGDPYFELVVETLEQARSAAARDGAELLVVLFPTKEEVYLPLVGKPAPRLVPPFVEELEKRSLPYLDLTPSFQEQARRGDCTFFEVDGHPNQRGSELIAEAIVDAIHDRTELATALDRP